MVPNTGDNEALLVTMYANKDASSQNNNRSPAGRQLPEKYPCGLSQGSAANHSVQMEQRHGDRAIGVDPCGHSANNFRIRLCGLIELQVSWPVIEENHFVHKNSLATSMRENELYQGITLFGYEGTDHLVDHNPKWPVC